MQPRDDRGYLGSKVSCPSLNQYITVDLESDFDVSDARRAAVAQAIGTWAFSAHDFTDDELLLGALMMLQHALSMPELEQWKMDTGGPSNPNPARWPHC